MKKTFRDNLITILYREPRYVWGGASDEKTGLDCSGLIYLAAKRSGLPVSRTTAASMYRGEHGWAATTITFDHRLECDLLFWTIQPTRPAGHVGVLISHPTLELAALHASKTKGAALAPLKGPLRQKLIAIHRLKCIGDQHEAQTN